MKISKPSEAAGNRVPRLVQNQEERRNGFDHGQQVKDRRAKLRDAFGHYNELYDLMPVSFLTLDRVGRILDLNDFAAHGGAADNGPWARRDRRFALMF